MILELFLVYLPQDASCDRCSEGFSDRTTKSTISHDVEDRLTSTESVRDGYKLSDRKRKHNAEGNF